MKKIIYLLLAGIVFGSVGTAFALSQLFSDVPDNTWYSNAVNSLSEKEIIEGYEDGTFRPANDINRAEMAVMLDRAIHYVELKYKNEGLITAETVNIIANADPKCLEVEDVSFEDASVNLHIKQDKFYWEWSGPNYYCEIDAETGVVTDSYFMEL